MTIRAALCAGASFASLGLSGAAFAQEDVAQPATDIPADQAAQGNEIIVTATKREQTLQEVPVAVSVTTAETIERAQIRDIKDLSTVVPSLRVVEHQSSAQTDFLIRGFGNGANNAGIEPSVGVFIDGVYRSRSAAQIADFPDVQRIEVLRGPQSTLFGKNASVGVISIVTQAPKFNFGGNLEASYGKFNALVLKGLVTGPITDTLAVSLAAGYNKRDGYVRDLGTGNRENERNRWFVRGQLLFEPTDQLKVRIIGDYGKMDEICCAVVNVRAATPTAIITTPTTTIIPGVGLGGLGKNVNSASNPFGDVVYNNFDSTNHIENYGVSGQIDYEMGPFSLTSITAWRKNRGITQQDSDFTSANTLGEHDEDLQVSTFTQELRLSANFADRVNLLIGGYYFNEKIRQDNSLKWGSDARLYFDRLIRGQTGGAGSLFTTVPAAIALESTFGALEGNPAKYTGQFFAPGSGLNEQYRLDNNAISVFGQVDFKVTDRLTLTGGANYTRDRKTFATNVVSTDAFAKIDFNNPLYAPLRVGLLQQLFGFSPAAAIATQATPELVAANNPLSALRALQIFPQFLNVPNSVENGKTSDGNVSYTARLAYEVNDHINVYVSYATGFKASSINLGRDSRPLDNLATRNAITTAGLAQINQSYGSRFALPEKSTVYEAGLKADWGVASANVAVFKQVINDFQSNIFTGIGFFLGNAGKQSTFGIEFDGLVRPTKSLTLGVAMTYLAPKYDDFRKSAFGDASGLRPAGIPAISSTFSIDWNHELANSDRIIVHGDFHYESPVQILDGLPGFIAKDPLTGVPTAAGLQAGLDAARAFRREVNEMNASLTYAMHNGLELTVWGRNLLNNRYLYTIFDSPAQPGSVSAYPNQPLTWGGAVRFRW
ncbi:MAG: TonB-dependent receptor [Novosphingobium sp.]